MDTWCSYFEVLDDAGLTVASSLSLREAIAEAKEAGLEGPWAGCSFTINYHTYAGTDEYAGSLIRLGLATRWLPAPGF